MLTPNTTEGLHVVLDGLSWHEGDEVVVGDEENPAVLVAVANFAARRGIAVKRVPVRDPRGVAAALADVITARTRLVVLSHVTHATGFLLPVEEVVAVTRRQGVPLLLDGAQAIGQVPFAIGASGVDFYTGAGYKWTMGPYGVGFLYVRRDWIERLAAARVGVGAQESFDADTFGLTLRPDAGRFSFGARPWPLFIAWAASIEWLAEIGMPFVVARIRQLREHALGTLAGDDRVVPVPGNSSGGLLTVTAPGIDARKVVEELGRRGIIAEWRRLPPAVAPNATGVRLSLGFFLLKSEVDQAIRALREVVGELATRVSDRPAPGPST